MKNAVISLVKLGLALGAGIILHSSVQAQCSANNLLTKTYDTTLTSTGFKVYNLTFPQWNPEYGTLFSVKISATTNSQYQFTLRNADTATSTYLLTVGQEDKFVSSALPSTFTNLTSKDIDSYTLAPNQSITQAPFAFLTNYTASDSVTAVAPFLGTGNISISYTSYTYTNLGSYNNSSYDYSTTIADNMKVRVQYQYCHSGIVLATGLTDWNAVPDWPSTALLNWAMSSEKPNRQYLVQRSDDGKTFTTVATVPATNGSTVAQYNYADVLNVSSPHVYFYRLQVDDSDWTSYSTVKQVLLGWSPPAFKVYPNPATSFINISGGYGSDWQTEIFSCDGKLVQRDFWPQAETFRIQFHSRLAPGAYFVRTIDLKSQKSQVSSFIVTGTN